MPFTSEEDAYRFYNAYAGKIGFSVKCHTKHRADGTLSSKYFVCKFLVSNCISKLQFKQFRACSLDSHATVFFLSHLIVCVVSSQHNVPASLLDWSVGSDSWSEMQLGNSLIEQIVVFNSQFIAMDSYYSSTLSLAGAEAAVWRGFAAAIPKMYTKH